MVECQGYFTRKYHSDLRDFAGWRSWEKDLDDTLEGLALARLFASGLAEEDGVRPNYVKAHERMAGDVYDPYSGEHINGELTRELAQCDSNEARAQTFLAWELRHY